mgnify:CR=1 FL=1
MCPTITKNPLQLNFTSSIGNLNHTWIDPLISYQVGGEQLYSLGGPFLVKEDPDAKTQQVINELNDKPRKRKKEEEERKKKKTQHFIKKEKEKNYQHSAYELRKRAKAVGLDLLPAGRHSKGVRKEWLLKLEQLEKQLNNT